MINLKFLIPHLILFIVASSCAPKEKAFNWPNGTKAAIALTYDDGLSSHVNTAAPALNQYGFKATFYPTISSPSLIDEKEKWKKLPIDGHELGNHTVYHPCQKSKEGMEWVKDEYDLDTYTSQQIAQEINLANTLLTEMDGQDSRTFAYPCSHHYAGGESYLGYVSSQFTSARSSSGEQSKLVKVSDIDLYNIPSWSPNNHEADELISYVQNIIEHKTFSTLTFHGIGAEHLTVSKEDHDKMLQFLDDNRDKIWVGTLEEITTYMRLKRTTTNK